MSNLQPGQMIGPYQIINQIGQGGMATVYKAYHAAMDRYVAVKVLPYQFAQSEQFLGRFKQEVRLIASLEHIHILPVYDYGEKEGIPYLVMRHLDGGTLKDRIQPSGQDRSAPLTLEKIDQFFAPLAEALDYAHRRGVIHRDIKPANVMLDQEEILFLTDFGIAKLVEGSVKFTASGAITGTPAYMSPEQGEGKPLDLRTDIYSLGIVLYEMLTGRVPFSAETPMAVVIKHMQEPLPPPSSIKPDIDPDIEAVVLKALAKDRDDRFASMHDFLVAWKKALEKIRQTQLRETTYRVPLGISVSKAPETTSGEEATIDEFVPLPITKSSSSSQSVASTISTTLQSAPKWLLPVIGLGGISLIVVLVLTIGPLFFNPADNKPSTSLESSNGTLLTTETSLLSSTTVPGPTLATLPPLLSPEQRDMYAGTFAGPAPPEAWPQGLMAS